MNKILSNIRSVSGVWGTIAIDKQRALTYQMLPASYGSEQVKNIAIPTLNLARSAERNMLVDIFFENGKGRIYNYSDVVVLILGRKDLDFDMLGSVCKVAIPALSRRLARGDLSESVITCGGDTGSISFDYLLKAINILAFNAQQKIGAYLVTKHLRNAKDALVNKYQFLTTVTVDNNGVAALIKGYTGHRGDNLLQGFAHWANLFITNCATSTDKLDPADILELTMEVKDKLEISGFYQLYADMGI
ncbi:MAG: hypothetical protein V3W18_01455 [candidate division Zixibacteria bacterium]